MIVVVTGSRRLIQHDDRLAIKARFLSAIHALNPTTVHHGGAAGPDTWALMQFWEIHKHHPPQRTPGRTPAQRLYDRNITMIDAAVRQGETTMVSCWDGQSRGTVHAINYALSIGIPIVHSYKQPEAS